VDGIYIDITLQKGHKMKLMTIVLQKNFNISAGFLVFFIVTESIMSWDGLCLLIGSVLCLDGTFIKFLRKWYHCDCISYCVFEVKGYLEHVNTSHIHDLAMFGFSIFWTYLWFSQFMLIWYANIPEELILSLG
jgi:hypothetical protein